MIIPSFPWVIFHVRDVLMRHRKGP